MYLQPIPIHFDVQWTFDPIEIMISLALTKIHRTISVLLKLKFNHKTL